MTTPVWTWQANWREGVAQSLEWLTAIQPARDGSEDRQQLREWPRCVASFQCDVTDYRARLLDARIWKDQVREWLMPIWWDVSRLTAAASAGESTIYLETADRYFRFGASVTAKAVLLGPDGDYEVVETSVVYANRIALDGTLAGDWPKGTRVYPAELAYIGQAQEVARPTAGITRLEVRAEYTRPFDAAATEGTAYDGLPVLDETPNRASAVGATYQRIADRIDMGLGRPLIKDISGRPMVSRAHEYLLEGRSEIKDFLDRLRFLAGRHQGFWCASHQSDLVVTDDIGATDTTIRVEKLDYGDHYDTDLGRSHIAIMRKGAATLYREVTASASVDADHEDLTIATALGESVTAGQIRKVSWLEKVRLASDTIEVSRPTSAVATLSLPLRMLRT